MLVSDAQREIRTVYLGGFVGQLVSSMIWFASAAIATFIDPVTGFWALAIGGATIFPLTQAGLRLAGHRTAISKENPLGSLAMQIAFTVPLVLPIAGTAALHRQGWFYPACLVIVGAALFAVCLPVRNEDVRSAFGGAHPCWVCDRHMGLESDCTRGMGRGIDLVRVGFRAPRCLQEWRSGLS